MKNHQGLSGKMFSTLGKTMSISELPKVLERNISAVINQRDVKKALNTLHERFFEDNTKQLNLFVMGVGNVGEKFIAQINQKEIPEGNPKMNLRVIALSNSKNDFDEDGIDLKWQSAIDKENPDQELFIKSKDLNLRNSIFVDITANESVSETYEHF
jgi:aspartokinase/homoserine dehydrogenase 1